jgi:hypothetical protein
LGLDGEVPDHSTFSKNRHGRFRESDLLRMLAPPKNRRGGLRSLVVAWTTWIIGRWIAGKLPPRRLFSVWANYTKDLVDWFPRSMRGDTIGSFGAGGSATGLTAASAAQVRSLRLRRDLNADLVIGVPTAEALVKSLD